MVIETTITGDGLKGTLQDGSAITGGSLSGKVVSTLPTDGTSPMISATNKLHAVININLPGGVGKATITTDREVIEQRPPARPGSRTSRSLPSNTRSACAERQQWCARGS